MQLFLQRGTSPIKHSTLVSDSGNDMNRSASVVVGVSLARLAHAHDAELNRHSHIGSLPSGDSGLCTLEVGRAATHLPALGSEAPPETSTPEASCGETGARLSVDDIECGVVDLSSRDLRCVLPQIALFATNVTSLNLSRNALRCLPDEIGYLVCLQHIDVSQNCLESLPDTLAFCQTLHTIDAGQNKLAELPLSMRHCRLLRKVVLADNVLESVPSCLWSLASLTSLNLANNRIRALPARMFMPGGVAATNRPPALHLDLYGCPVGQGLTDHVPSPPLVLSARFKYGVTIADFGQQSLSLDSQTNTAPRRILSLVDTILCKMANSNADYPYGLPDHLQERLGSLVVCDHCHALYPADMGVKRWRLIHRQNSVWPVEYSFCQPHWSDEKQRIASLFAPRILESARPYSEPKRVALAQAQASIAKTCKTLNQASVSSLAALASRLSLSIQADVPATPGGRCHSRSSWRKCLYSVRQKSKQLASQELLAGINASAGHRSSFLGLRLPCFATSADTLDPEPLTVWQHYEGYVPSLPAMQRRRVHHSVI